MMSTLHEMAEPSEIEMHLPHGTVVVQPTPNGLSLPEDACIRLKGVGADHPLATFQACRVKRFLMALAP